MSGYGKHEIPWYFYWLNTPGISLLLETEILYVKLLSSKNPFKQL